MSDAVYEPADGDIVEIGWLGMVQLSAIIPEEEDEQDALLPRDAVVKEWYWDDFPGYRSSGRITDEEVREQTLTCWRVAYNRPRDTPVQS